jgi:hypothetical protein
LPDIFGNLDILGKLLKNVESYFRMFGGEMMDEFGNMEAGSATG